MLFSYFLLLLLFWCSDNAVVIILTLSSILFLSDSCTGSRRIFVIWTRSVRSLNNGRFFSSVLMLMVHVFPVMLGVNDTQFSYAAWMS